MAEFRKLKDLSATTLAVPNISQKEVLHDDQWCQGDIWHHQTVVTNYLITLNNSEKPGWGGPFYK